MVALVILVSRRVRVLFKMGAAVVEETKVYTLSEIDIQLEFLSNLLIYSKYGDKNECLDKIDEWLDRRIVLMGLETQYAC